MRFVENGCLHINRNKKKTIHLALRLPEIVSHIMYFLTAPYQYDENNKAKTFQYIYPCLFVNVIWHDCALRLIWRHITFEDSKSEYDAFLKFAHTIANRHPQTSYSQTDLNSSAAGLAIAVPKASNSLAGPDKRFLFSKHQDNETKNRIAINMTNTLEDHPTYATQTQVQRAARLYTSKQHQASNYSNFSANHHHYRCRSAVRTISLRKIKEKNINEPLQLIGSRAKYLEKLDIYICDHLSDSSIYAFISHHNCFLSYLSLAGCNRITDDAILNVARHCPRLEHLDLRACGLISDTSIQAIANCCPRLHHLNVGRVRDREKITMQSINLIAQKTQVAVLGLAGCDMTDECLILLAKCRGEKLERISVNNCYRITNKTIQAYVKYCPNLSVFEMKECHWIDDWASVAELVQRKVLLTLCDQQNKACAEWARRRGKVMEVKAPVK
ncbi:Antagonist of mitotic exit network protein 1 [Choanephora cucurbitarum]|uniref:Antagonist of mitotic exit network protein 1 n=1 Tax=Choanephora cucurbitarum TaxID=101091 RepID=A0A1C7NPA7_9FUNG|nr:Antagonist of mitotic exit network protein 1 [Choanephora cucurbitarum]